MHKWEVMTILRTMMMMMMMMMMMILIVMMMVDGGVSLSGNSSSFACNHTIIVTISMIHSTYY